MCGDVFGLLHEKKTTTSTTGRQTELRDDEYSLTLSLSVCLCMCMRVSFGRDALSCVMHGTDWSAEAPAPVDYTPAGRPL